MGKSQQTRAKRERVVEAVRRGLEGDAAVEFIHQHGYAMSQSGIARHLRAMGGRGKVQEMIDSGYSNLEILRSCFPQDDFSELEQVPPKQEELFETEVVSPPSAPFPDGDKPLYETTKLTIRVPADLYEALRAAAKAEDKSQNQLVIEILTYALSHMPGRHPQE